MLIANGIDPRVQQAEDDGSCLGITFAEFAEHWKNFKLKKLGVDTLNTALKHYQGDRRIQLGVKRLFLTAVRPGELRFAEPEHFDLEAGLWKDPPERVKQLWKLVRHAPRGTQIHPSKP